MTPAGILCQHPCLDCLQTLPCSSGQLVKPLILQVALSAGVLSSLSWLWSLVMPLATPMCFKWVAAASCDLTYQLHCLQIMDGGFSLMLRHRLHCKIERADDTGYLGGEGPAPSSCTAEHLTASRCRAASSGSLLSLSTVRTGDESCLPCPPSRNWSTVELRELGANAPALPKAQPATAGQLPCLHASDCPAVVFGCRATCLCRCSQLIIPDTKTHYLHAPLAPKLPLLCSRLTPPPCLWQLASRYIFYRVTPHPCSPLLASLV